MAQVVKYTAIPFLVSSPCRTPGFNTQALKKHPRSKGYTSVSSWVEGYFNVKPTEDQASSLPKT